MIPKLAYASRGFYIFNQIKSQPTYLLGLETISL